MDPLAGTPWSQPSTVAGFSQSQPNATLMQFAQAELQRSPTRRAIDLGVGAARNAVPLVRQGWTVLGIDMSRAMLEAAAERVQREGAPARLQLALAPMDAIPAADRQFDLVIAHGIWNLARSSAEFRRAVQEGARVARPGAALFVFTFSRNTLPDAAAPVAGEPFVYTQFSGQPQCFLTEQQLMEELRAAGFVPDPGVPLREHNRRTPGMLQAPTGPVIYEAAFRFHIPQRR